MLSTECSVKMRTDHEVYMLPKIVIPADSVTVTYRLKASNLLIITFIEKHTCAKIEKCKCISVLHVSCTSSGTKQN